MWMLLAAGQGGGAVCTEGRGVGKPGTGGQWARALASRVQAGRLRREAPDQ